MRAPFETVGPEMPLPDAAWWLAARDAPATVEAHGRLLASCPALATIRVVQPPAPAAAPSPLSPPSWPLRVAAWNVERLKFVEETAALLAREAFDIVLLTEVDIGMARSGDRDTVADLAARLGFAHAFGVEFVELGLGDDREARWHAGQTNRAGLHGNACLSRFPIDRAVVLPLDDGGAWFREGGQIDQRRVGTRNAVAIRTTLADGSGLWTAAVHLESRHDAQDRARETQRLLAGLDAICEGEPILIGGDLNTATMPDDPTLAEAALADPVAREPLLAHAREAGFAWREANTPAPTQRTRPDGTPAPPFRKIDWFLARGLACADPAVLPAVDAHGSAISDHECLALTIRPQERPA